MLYDLSWPIEDGMPVYPGDDGVEIRQVRHFETDGYNAFRTVTGQHAGTHVDSPMHMSADPVRIGAWPLDRFTGDARIVDARGMAVIGPEAVPEAWLVSGAILLFCTGAAAQYGLESYYREHPVLSDALAERLVQAGVKLVGVDAPSPDRFPFSVHTRLFAAGVPIVENLRGLERLLPHPGAGRFFGFPLALEADASPIRAVMECAD